MLDHWFLTQAVPLTLCQPYHPVTWLVIGSCLAAAFAAYTAFDMIARARQVTSRAEHGLWLATAGLSMGLSIWVMNIVSMLVVEVPLPPQLDLPLTALSGVFSVLTAILAFKLMMDDGGKRGRLVLAGICLGGGIALTHYTGMAALRIPAHIYYDPWMFAFSVVVPVILAIAALLALSTVPLFGPRHVVLARTAGAAVMGMAVVLMHYTGMFATNFCAVPETIDPAAFVESSLRTPAIAMGSILLFGLALIAALFDRRVERAEGFLRESIDSLPEGFVIFDRETRFVLCNETWRRFIRGNAKLLKPGAKLEDILRDDFRRGIFADTGGDEDAWIAGQTRVRLDKTHASEQQLADGTWVSITNRGMENGSIAGLWLDITERKTAEAVLREEKKRLDLDISTLRSTRVALLEREKRMDRAQEITGTGTWEFDTATERMLWSREMYRLRDITPEPLEHGIRPVSLGVHRDDAGRFEDWLKRLRMGLATDPIEYRLARPDGQECIVLADARGVSHADGALMKIVGTECDITERRLIDQQLIQARRLRVTGHLAGGLIQNFNNHLGSIIGHLDLAADQAAPGTAIAKWCLAARESALDAADMVKSLVNFAEAKRLGHDDTADTSAALANLLPMVKHAIGGKALLESRLDHGLWSPDTADDQLETALIDLVGLARDALPAGATIAIAAANKTIDTTVTTSSGTLPPGDYLTVAVSGETIEDSTPDQALAHIAGLDTIIDRITRARGAVDLEGTAGQPMSVRLWLPASGRDTDTPALGGPPAHILMVEANPEMRAIGASILRGLGHDISLAATGAEAMEMIETGQPFDLLFSDVAMPGALNGLALAKAARARDPDVRVLFSSGFANPAALRFHMGDLGADVIRKPYRRHDLIELVRATLRKSRGQRTQRPVLLNAFGDPWRD